MLLEDLLEPELKSAPEVPREEFPVVEELAGVSVTVITEEPEVDRWTDNVGVPVALAVGFFEALEADTDDDTFEPADVAEPLDEPELLEVPVPPDEPVPVDEPVPLDVPAPF
jgi:hypothetical protein